MILHFLIILCSISTMQAMYTVLLEEQPVRNHAEAHYNDDSSKEYTIVLNRSDNESFVMKCLGENTIYDVKRSLENKTGITTDQQAFVPISRYHWWGLFLIEKTMAHLTCYNPIDRELPDEDTIASIYRKYCTTYFQFYVRKPKKNTELNDVIIST